MYGSTFKHNKVLVGMMALLPYCETCDQVKTQGSHRRHYDTFGWTQAELWLYQLKRLEADGIDIPPEVIEAIRDWGR
jgi:hypothetical protein